MAHYLSIESKRRSAGFSLVELSIVLVIIGLIVSSVLVGQDLVRSAELRALASQYEEFNKAAATFRDKYSGLPGDVRADVRFGFGVAEAGTTEDGLLEDAAGNYSLHSGEYTRFWNHLGGSGAGLIPESYAGGAVHSADISTILPQSEQGGYWGTFSLSTGENYFIYGAADNGSSAAWYTENILSPKDMLSIDSKIDDGRPGRGILRARGQNATNPLTNPGAGAALCVSAAGADGDYNVDLNDPLCTFSVLMRI
ncbi:MAG: prepilin-type N-terminal cleavage/methylation domain-containing protein [Rickettsiales bacterium]